MHIMFSECSKNIANTLNWLRILDAQLRSVLTPFIEPSVSEPSNLCTSSNAFFEITLSV